jgi:hypothetical protein
VVVEGLEGKGALPPVAPAIVATWLVERADAGAARSTLTVALAAIEFGHKIAGQRFHGADPELLRALAYETAAAMRGRGGLVAHSANFSPPYE